MTNIRFGLCRFHRSSVFFLTASILTLASCASRRNDSEQYGNRTETKEEGIHEPNGMREMEIIYSDGKVTLIIVNDTGSVIRLFGGAIKMAYVTKENRKLVRVSPQGFSDMHSGTPVMLVWKSAVIDEQVRERQRTARQHMPIWLAPGATLTLVYESPIIDGAKSLWAEFYGASVYILSDGIRIQEKTSVRWRSNELDISPELLK